MFRSKAEKGPAWIETTDPPKLLIFRAPFLLETAFHLLGVGLCMNCSTNPLIPRFNTCFNSILSSSFGGLSFS